MLKSANIHLYTLNSGWKRCTVELDVTKIQNGIS